MGYWERALKAKDPRYANILRKLGYDRRDLQARPAAAAPVAVAEEPASKPTAPMHDDDDDLAAVRAEYERVVGRKPYHGWDEDVLLAKIRAAAAGRDS